MGQPTEISEDIQAVRDRNKKYLERQREIRNVINTNEPDTDVLVDDVVDAICNLRHPLTLSAVYTLGMTVLKKCLRRRKFKKVAQNILTKLFEVNLGWYAMDYEDLRNTCDYIGGRDYFSRDDHLAIYIAVMQKLKTGPIRDKCSELGIVDFVNEKIVDIYDNYLEFKIGVL